MAPCGYRTGSDEHYRDVVDYEAGQILKRVEVDPGSQVLPGGEGRGNYWTITSFRTGYPNERLIPTSILTPNGRDAKTAAEHLVGHPERYEGVAGLVYDTNMSAETNDLLIRHGLIPVDKMPRNQRGEPDHAALGIHALTTRDGGKVERAIYTWDGSPAIKIKNGIDDYLVLFDRVQTKISHSAMYNICKFPDHPATPEGLIGAQLLTRMGCRAATPDDLPASHLRVIPERDPDFDPLFGPRQHTESINNHLQ